VPEDLLQSDTYSILVLTNRCSITEAFQGGKFAVIAFMHALLDMTRHVRYKVIEQFIY